MDLRLKNSSVFTIAGPSLSGKTVFVRQLITYAPILFEKPFTDIHWFCSFIPLHGERLPGVKYHKGLPSNFNMLQPGCCCVLDDLMMETTNDKHVTNLATKYVHHLPMTLFNVVQNVFHKGGESRTRNLNTHYLVLFKNPRDKTQIDYLSRQMFPKKKNFLTKVYEDVTEEHPYSYIMIDLHQQTPEAVRVRTNILPYEAPMIVFKPL